MMKRFLLKSKSFFKEEDGVFRNMAVLAAGAGAAKAISLCAIPVLTRVYTPEHFGILSAFLAIVSILSPVLSMRFVMAVPLPRNDRVAINVIVLCIISITLCTSFITGSYLLFGSKFLAFLSLEILEPYWWLVIFGILITSLYELLTLWATRMKDFKPVANSQVWQAVLGAIVKIALGLIGFKPFGLLFGQVAHQASGTIYLYKYFLRSLRGNRRAVTKLRLKRTFFYYLDLPKYRLPSQFLMVFSAQIPLLLSAGLFGAEAAGQLGLALMALALPFQLSGSTTGKAYFAEISRIGKQKPEQILSLTDRVIKRLFLVSLFPCMLLFLGGGRIFSFVFGEEWLEAGNLASALSVYLLFQFASSPVVNALAVFEKNKLFLYINAARATIVVLIFASANVLNWSLHTTVVAYSIALAIHYAVTLRIVYKNIK